MHKCIVLMGPPCSGKSTIGKELASHIGFKYVSSGDIARKMAEEDGNIDNLNAGKMAPEVKMRNEIAKVFNDAHVNGDCIILDGFPRFLEQWAWLIANFEFEFAYVIVDVPTLTLFNRVIGRGRADDVAFIERLEYYMKNTVPVINQLDSHSMMYNEPMIMVNNTITDDAVESIKELLHDRSWI